jgi:hydrogenase nickel incorporation protein HypB
MKVNVMSDILKANDLLAGDLRAMLGGKGIVAWNVMGSPGSGKTSVLERLIPMLSPKAKVAVIEGDLSTSRDAERVAKTGAQAVQINTRGGCHLDAAMVRSALEKIDLDGLRVLFIENVGNLVCPSDFDLGESGRIIVSSVAEGDDKPEKYPPMFRGADLVLVNKIDLLKLTDFSIESFKRGIRKAGSRATVIPVSATGGAGFPELLDWIAERLPE